MIIVHVCKVWYPRITGVTVHVDQLARRMAEAGHEVHVVTYDLSGERAASLPPGMDATTESRSGFTVHYARPGSLVSFRNLIVSLRPDAIHAHGIWEHVFPAFLASRHCGARFFLTAHGTWQFLYDTPGMENPGRRLKYRLYYHTLWRWMVRSAHSMIALNAIEESAHRKLGAKRIARIPNGVCCDEFHPEAGKGMALARLQSEFQSDLPVSKLPDPHSPFFLFAGSVQRQKGIFTLLEALVLLKERGVDAPPVLIAGDGPELHRAQNLVRKHKLEIFFLGRIPRHFMPMLMADASLFVLPSLDEPFATVYLEALASGTPCIGTDSGGTPEIIAHDRTGWRITPENASELAELLSRLISAPDTLTNASRNTRTAARSAFDWSILTPRILCQYAASNSAEKICP